MSKPAFTMAALILLLVRAAPAQQASQTPRFQTSIEVTSLDVGVVDSRGRPITNLGPDAFVVRIDGRPRRVVSANWVPLVGASNRLPLVPVPEGFSSNENTREGRIIIIAVDQPHIRVGGTPAILSAAGAFVDRLSPSDVVAVVGLSAAMPTATLTADRGRIKAALARMTGEKQHEEIFGEYNIALVEALAITDGDVGMIGSVMSRECPVPPSPTADPATQQAAFGAKLRCRAQIESEAGRQAGQAALGTDMTMRGLRELMNGLATVDAPKTLVLISEGFVLTNNEAFVNELGAMAASTRTSLYAVQLDDEAPFTAETRRRPVAPRADARERSLGLELLSAAARGTLFTTAGSGAQFFNQLEAELSGYYLLGVESDPRDRDGRAHRVQIDVPQRGAIVRSRRQTITPADSRRSPSQAVTANLRSPLIASALPLRVATFAFQGADSGQVQMLVHADVGRDYSDSKAVSVGYTITDRAGRVVEGWTLDSQLAPITPGVPSPLQFDAAASLPPGDYTLKFVAAEGDRTGSVEHAMHAALADIGGARFSQLVVGGTVGTKSVLTPTIGFPSGFNSVHGYVEGYGPRLDTLGMQYEIAVNPTAPALISAVVAGRRAADDRMIFAHGIPTNQLPPGAYVLRVTASSTGTPLDTIIRRFDVAPRVPRLASTTAGAAAGGAVVLPVDWQAFTNRSFRQADALTPGALKPFRDRVAPVAAAAFETGVTSLKAGDYPKAEASLKRAIRPDVDSTAAMVYLAITYAASGHDVEASAVWETALTDGSGFPQIYDWLAESLLRLRRLPEARAILEEALGKWPKDTRFTWPLANLYAGLGEGAEALDMLERHVSARPNDLDALQQGVEWIYEAHASGKTLRGAAEDLKLVRAFADAYTRAAGPRSALVAHWLAYLERDKR